MPEIKLSFTLLKLIRIWRGKGIATTIFVFMAWSYKSMINPLKSVMFNWSNLGKSYLGKTPCNM